MAFNSINIIHPFYLQDVILLTAGAAGLFMMISPVVMFVMSPLSGYMSDKFGSEGRTCIGLLTEACGLFLLSTLTEASPMAVIGCFIGLTALGAALFQSPNNALTMSTVPGDQLGVAGSVNALVRNLGMTFGILLSTGILYNRMSDFEGQEVTDIAAGMDAAAFVYGMHWAYLTASLICLAGAISTGLRLINKKRQP
jgi:MFS family permease